MRHNIALLLAVLGCCGLVAAQYYEPIQSDNGMPWRGKYGDMDICHHDKNFTYTYALDFKFDDLNDLDNVGGNAVKLYCRDHAGSISGYVTSIEGKRGDWQGIHSCPPHAFFNGFRLRVFPEQGTWGDDFGVDNIQMSCEDGTIVDGIEGVLTEEGVTDEVEKSVLRQWVDKVERKMEVIRYNIGKTRIHGEWGSWVYCSPGMYVVGLRTVVEEGHIDDDAGLTDVILYCF
ncbi:uncharacterized protein LOC123503221 isoform X2 [Portunus trituberculatus]|uniref:uncharacterized protein LOC123503221 isoform X2 n=1 Tax=Portunus trituberculatus TaxID=210409 RepID=UPI001E1D1B36|nr:uncharacterized protein LOC123503221 isoform X2 [Portunus trituberculatus]